MGHDEVCKSDNFCINFDIKLDIKTQKTVKRKM